jgi:RNA polymerase sigma-70 factor (ECF subfamily)
MIRRRTDPAPIEPLFRAHFDAIFRYASCRVGRDAALDVASETFAQALRSIGRLDPDREPRPWLFGIAANVLRHHSRAEARRLGAYARVERPTGPSSRGDEHMTDHSGAIVEALSALTPEDRETILLFAWADLSYDEIADALGIPVGTVRSRINRARRLLRNSLTLDDRALVAAGEEA